MQIETGQLGNPPAKRLMEELKPKFWFSAHHHIKFAALFSHQDNLEPPNKKQKAEEGIKETGEESKSNSDPMFTRFLALDKCIPNRRFLQVELIQISVDSTSMHVSLYVSQMSLCTENKIQPQSSKISYPHSLDWSI